MLCLSDPTGIVEGQLALSPEAFLIAALLDGKNDSHDIQQAFAVQTDGAKVLEGQILGLVHQLDEAGFLETPTFERLRDSAHKAFAALPQRPAALAGISYPDEPGELREYLHALLHRDGTPEALAVKESDPVRALVVPHIDYERGAEAYAHAYGALKKAAAPETVIIFGVAHAAEPVPFILTRKHFETPLGTVETDQGLVDQLAGSCDWDPFAYEFSHKNEHSIEFQAVILPYLYGADIRIVPILCSVFSEDPAAGTPTQDVAITRFLAACRDILFENAGVVAMAAADLAHVGKRFGDPFDITDAVTTQIEQRDREDLAHVLGPDAEAFYASVMRDGNARKVCGLNSIYATLKSVEGLVRRGVLLSYGQAADPTGQTHLNSQ